MYLPFNTTAMQTYFLLLAFFSFHNHQAQYLDQVLDEIPMEFNNETRVNLQSTLVRDGIILWPDLLAALFPGVSLSSAALPCFVKSANRNTFFSPHSKKPTRPHPQNL